MPDGEYWGSPQPVDNPVSGVGIASARARRRGRGRPWRGSAGTRGRRGSCRAPGAPRPGGLPVGGGAENAMTVWGPSDRMWAMVEQSADGAVPERWTASTAHADMWMDPADDPRETETELGDERSVLVEYVR